MESLCDPDQIVSLRVRGKMVFWKRFSALLAAVALAAPALGAFPAMAQKPVTPRPGSAERTQILDAIRRDFSRDVRFIVHGLFVMKGRDATFAYADVVPSKGDDEGGEFILEARGPGRKWRVIWSVRGGGTSDCEEAADYYRSVARYLQARGVRVGDLNPTHEEELKSLTASDGGCWTIGDLGPELPNAGH